MTFASDPAMALLCGIYAGGDLEARGEEAWLVCRTAGSELLIDPELLDELAARGWVEVDAGDLVQSTEKGDYAVRKWFRMTPQGKTHELVGKGVVRRAADWIARCEAAAVALGR